MKIGRGMNVCKNRKNVHTDGQTDRQTDDRYTPAIMI